MGSIESFTHLVLRKSMVDASDSRTVGFEPGKPALYNITRARRPVAGFDPLTVKGPEHSSRALLRSIAILTNPSSTEGQAELDLAGRWPNLNAGPREGSEPMLPRIPPGAEELRNAFVAGSGAFAHKGLRTISILSGLKCKVALSRNARVSFQPMRSAAGAIGILGEQCPASTRQHKGT